MPKNSGLKLLAHDGKNLKSVQSIDAGQLRSMKGKNLIEVSTENLPQVKDKFHEGLGKTEITSIAGVDKDDSAGWQGYFAYLKDGKVISMGLPHVTHDGEDFFLPLENITIGNLASMIESLPEGVELALVWRLDRDMIKDIEMKKNSVVYSIDSVNQPVTDSLDFGLLNEKRPVGCGGAMGKDLTVEVAEVKLYCGEDDDPIRMNLMSAVPSPESFQFDCFDSPNMFFQNPVVALSPIPVGLPREASVRDCCNNVAGAHEKNGRIHTEDNPAANLLLKITLIKPKENMFISSNQMDATSRTKPLTGDEAKRIVADVIIQNPIVRMIMNPAERRLWGRLHGFFSDASPCSTPCVVKAPRQNVQKQKSGPTFFAMKLPVRESTYVPAGHFSDSINPDPSAHIQTGVPQPSYKAHKEKAQCASNIQVPRTPRLHFVAPEPKREKSKKPSKTEKLVEEPPKKKTRKLKREIAPKLAAKKKEAPKRVAPPQAEKPDELKNKKALCKSIDPRSAAKEIRVSKPRCARKANSNEVVAAKKRKPAPCKTKLQSRRKKKQKMHPHYKNEMLGLKAKKKRTKRRRTRAKNSL